MFGFIDRPQAENLLYSANRSGAFLLRFSERVAGQLAVSYLVRSIDSGQYVVRHYLIKDSDTAGAKKTLPDFLREYKEFHTLLMLKQRPDGSRYVELHDKHSVLEDLYSKKVESSFEGYEESVTIDEDFPQVGSSSSMASTAMAAIGQSSTSSAMEND